MTITSALRVAETVNCWALLAASMVEKIQAPSSVRDLASQGQEDSDRGGHQMSPLASRCSCTHTLHTYISYIHTHTHKTKLSCKHLFQRPQDPTGQQGSCRYGVCMTRDWTCIHRAVEGRNGFRGGCVWEEASGRRYKTIGPGR